MIRPHNFRPNPETEADNTFQYQAASVDAQDTARSAYIEFNNAVSELRKCGINVHVFDDTSTETPDSVFPNNWFSTHPNGQVVVYPMYAPNRRKERRQDVIEMLEREYCVSQVIDYAQFEHENLYLEGTGAMVIDHLEKVVYMVPSNRANPALLNVFCKQLGYNSFSFHAQDANGVPIYHSNVFMSITNEFAVLALDMIPSLVERDELVKRMTDSGREIILVSGEQIAQFAGNCIELTGSEGRILALSQTAYNTLTPAQKSEMEKSVRLLPIKVNTIEMAGGSVRCMIAGIHLLPK